MSKSQLELGEPLLNDQRLFGVADRIMVEFPKLIDFGTDLVTWVQEPETVRTDDGLVRKIPRVAVIAMVSPHPKNPTVKQLTRAGMWLSDWREEEESFGRINNAPDPALKFFRVVAKEHLAMLENLVSLMD